MTKAGRIAVVSHAHPDLSKGGAELAAYALYQGLRAAGEDAIFVASCLEQDVCRVEPREGEFLLPREPELYDMLYHIAPPGEVQALTRLLEAEGVTTAYFHHFLFLGLNGMQSAARSGIDCYLTLHEYLAICLNHGQMVTRPAKALCRRSGRQVCGACFPENHGEEIDLRKARFQDAFAELKGLFSPSDFLKDRFTDWGIPPERIHVVENGIWGLDDKRALAGPRPDATGDEVMTIGYFGQITPFKGVSVILDCVEELERARRQGKDLPPIKFRIHGNLVGLEEAFVDRFERLAKRSPILRYAGAYANAEVVSLMQACDYVIAPSQWWENSPVVLQEAYASGCPVIASGIGGLAEKVVDGVTGLHFEVGDAQSLLKVLERAADPKVLKELRGNLPTPPVAEDMAAEYLAAG